MFKSWDEWSTMDGQVCEFDGVISRWTVMLTQRALDLTKTSIVWLHDCRSLTFLCHATEFVHRLDWHHHHHQPEKEQHVDLSCRCLHLDSKNFRFTSWTRLKRTENRFPSLLQRRDNQSLGLHNIGKNWCCYTFAFCYIWQYIFKVSFHSIQLNFPSLTLNWW